MAESTLSITYDELAVAVAVFLGYSTTAADWSAEELAEIDRYIQAGIRQFYYPPSVDGIQDAHVWSFLNPTTTLDTITRYATGSLAVVTGTCTLTDGTWPTWAVTHGTLIIDDTEYSITSRDSNTELTVVGDDVTAEEDGWHLGHAGYQDLPDDLARVIGDFYYASVQYRSSIVKVSGPQIRAALSRTTDEAPPRMCTIRYKSQEATDAQRQEVVWFPKPSAVFTLEYEYEAYAGKLTTTANPYPLGGMRYSELVTESCLAIAEQRANDEKGLHTDAFYRLLKSGIAHDRKNDGTFYGPMSSGEAPSSMMHHRHHAAHVDYSITYKGETL